MLQILRRGAAAAALAAAVLAAGCEPAAPAVEAPATLARPAPTPTASTRQPPAALTAAATPQASPAPAPLAADFGDAPDGAPAGYAGRRVVGRFPTRLDTRSSPRPGAHVLTPGPDRLGEGVTAEASAADASDPDGAPNLVNADGADDGVAALTLILDRAPAQAVLHVTVALDAAAPPGLRFLNVLIDADLDGRWRGSAEDGAEWVVRNLAVQAAPGASTAVQAPPFDLGGEGRLPDGAWMRVVLSRQRIQTQTWDGGGRWTHGEVEDYQLELPRSSTGGVAGAPLALVAAACPDRIELASGALLARASCRLVNLGGDGVTALRLVRASGGARLTPDRVSGVDLRAGAAREVSLVVVRGERDSEWRYRAGQRVQSRAEGGAVVLGVRPADRTVTIAARDPGPWFHVDRAADYFSIHDRAPVEGFAFADIRRLASGSAVLSAADLETLRGAWFGVESAAPSARGETFAAFLVDLAGEAPHGDDTLGFQVAFAVRATSDPADDWTPRMRDFDLYQDTDTWFELVYRPSLTPAWRLQKRTSADPQAAAPTGAVAFVDGARVLLLVPTPELASEPTDLRFRVTTFVHEAGDPLGEDGLSMADAAPELDQPLAPYAAGPAAAG